MFSDVAVSANADGGIVLATTGRKNANSPAKATTSVVIKKNARATYKSVRNTVRANNFRKDQKVCHSLPGTHAPAVCGSLISTRRDITSYF